MFRNFGRFTKNALGGGPSGPTELPALGDVNAYWKNDTNLLNTSAAAPSNGDEIASWEDDVNGHTLTNLFNIGPTYDTAKASYPTLYFTGASVVENLSVSTGTILSSNYTLAMIMIPDEGSAATRWHWKGFAAAGEGSEVQSESAGVSVTLDFKSNPAYQYTLNFDTEYLIQHDGDATGGMAYGYVNGTQVYSDIYGYSSSNGFVLMNDQTSVKGALGWVAEVIVWNKVLSAAERSQLESYVNDKFGI